MLTPTFLSVYVEDINIDPEPADRHLLRIKLSNYNVDLEFLIIQPSALLAPEPILQCISN